ncbi:MAG: hypothetical protein KBB01_03525 [Candidatus Omnitrophica bacterium]|jgi:hypothetical protein|nr:hypothetical protein [Candidatus Omnitrophota bacterium]
MLIIFLFIFGIILRLIPHLPNFAPITAIALFSGAYLNKKYSLWVPISLYIISDLIIGLHQLVIFTWGSVLLITLLGRLIQKRRSLIVNSFYALISSLVFFIISNFGVWLNGWYGYTYSGLVECYIMAIPFLRLSLLADLLFIILLTQIYVFITAKVENQRIRTALLTN